MNEHSSQEVGAYTVRVVYDDGCRDIRDYDSVGRVAGLTDWTWNQDEGTYRDIRDAAGEPIVAIPLSVWDQSYTLLRETSWDDADGFYWAPWSAIEREGFADVDALKACLRAEIATLADELAGNVHGFIVEHTETERHEDSCYGFIGEPDYAMSEGVDIAEWANLRDAINWASLPEWVQHAVMIREEVNA